MKSAIINWLLKWTIIGFIYGLFAPVLFKNGEDICEYNTENGKIRYTEKYGFYLAGAILLSIIQFICLIKIFIKNK